MLRIAMLVSSMMFPSEVLAQGAMEAASSGEAWYKVVVGIIGIPAAALGILVAWNANKKTTLETQKLKLELAEKQKALQADSTPAEKLQILVEPLGKNQLALILIVRFVLLYLTLRLWDVVPAAVSALLGLVGGSFVGIIWLFNHDALDKIFDNESVGIVAVLVPRALGVIFSVMTWLILLGFGWPLFKDTCAFLNIPIKSLFDLPSLFRSKRS